MGSIQNNDITSKTLNVNTECKVGANSSYIKIINIVKRSLGYIDVRLMEHGERVAYIADKIAAQTGYRGIDRQLLYLLSVLHDIGAYKTEEIDNMVNFETSDVTNHAVYGYVFLRNITFLGDNAQAILYHHTDYKRVEELNLPSKLYSEIIYLADRLDILMVTGAKNLSVIRKYSGKTFSPDYIDAFFEAEEKENISKHIMDKSYEESVNAAIDELTLTNEQVMSFLRLLVYSIDFRSPFTVTHTANTTAISSFLASKAGLSEEETENVIQGAFLHDIGKLAIPYSILESPNRLTAEEMSVMRTHVEVSEKILTGIVPDEVCQIAIRHHEKLNGKGYFRNLTAEDLTIPQRIVAVSDVVSALLNKRSYKDAFPKEKVIAIITSMMENNELCPEICKLAINNFDEIIGITTKADDAVIKLYEKVKKQFSDLRRTFLADG